jgi:glutathione synthase
MSRHIGFIMDPIEHIKSYKDSTFAMMLAAQKRGWHIHYMTTSDLFLDNSTLRMNTRDIQVHDDPHHWFSYDSEFKTIGAETLDVLFMRKDPPFDINYLNTTYLLDHAKAQGVLVINDPQAIRDANEKMYTTWFPQCCVPYLVSSQATLIKQFIAMHKNVILKPLDSMGGDSIFKVHEQEPNINVILETLTYHGQRLIMAQQFIPDITEGDKRILLINGEPIPYALARIPAAGETRANLVAGGTGRGQALSDRDRWLCAQVGPTLRQRGLFFVGIDVIGDYLTEINVTSPTCIRELEQQFQLDIAGQLLDAVETQLIQRNTP